MSKEERASVSASASFPTSIPWLGIDDEERGLKDEGAPVITAAAEDRFLRAGSENPGIDSGFRILLFVHSSSE